MHNDHTVAGKTRQSLPSIALAMAVFVSLLPLAASEAQPSSAPPTPANPGVLRWAEGAYDYSAISDGHATGRETFSLTVAPDGTRTVRASTDIFSRGVQTNAVVRVAANFRPLTAYVDISTKGVLKGSALYVSGEHIVDATVVNAAGRQLHARDDVPDNFSVVTHQLVTDGWSSWFARNVPSQITKGVLYLVNGDASNDRPMVGELTPVAFEYVGEERITVPAGTFAASHFRVANGFEAWTTGEDRLLVKYVWRAIDRQYVLSKLTRGQNQPPTPAQSKGHQS